MARDILTVANLSKRFGAQTVIQDLSFVVRCGSRVTIWAPTGAGKTTLINVLTGLDLDYEGSFALAAEKPATIFQEPRLFPYMTVEENICLPARLRGKSQGRQERKTTLGGLPPEQRMQYRDWLDLCELSHCTKFYPHQLSGGMKQKVALIRCFLWQPDFVMMDEPFKSIDVRSKQTIIRHILEAYPQITILFVTHALDEIPLLTQTLLLFRGNQLTNLAKYETNDVLPPGKELMEVIYG